MNLNEIKIEYIISFSDALFAFSITFMALFIQIPTFSSNISDWELTQKLGQLLTPSIIHYILSFMVVGMYWIGYHEIFEHITTGRHYSSIDQLVIPTLHRISWVFYWTSYYI